MITLGKSPLAKGLNSLALIALLIYGAQKMELLPEFEVEVVKKVEIGSQIHSKMSASEIESSLGYYLYNESILSTDINQTLQDSITINYVLNDNGQIETIELLTSVGSKPAQELIKQVHTELTNYVSSQMLTRFEAPKTVKQINLPDTVVNTLSNEEVQTLLGEFLQSSEAVNKLNSEGFEFKFIINEEGQIWQFELVSSLPKKQAEIQLLSLEQALKEEFNAVLLSALQTKEPLKP